VNSTPVCQEKSWHHNHSRSIHTWDR